MIEQFINWWININPICKFLLGSYVFALILIIGLLYSVVILKKEERKTTIQKYKEGLIKIKFCLSCCPHLSPTEKDQSSLKEPHFCSLYNKRLFHLGHHPNIVSCKECPRKKG